MRQELARAGNGYRKSPTLLGSRLLTVVQLFMLLVALAAVPASGAPIRNPRLANLQIEIWPEYDRPAALVILRGRLAPDAALPADVSLRIAAASGGPSAMAYSAAEGGNLLNLEYEKSIAKDFITLRFKVPERSFHVEFYEPFPTGTPARSYSYAWPGDLRVDQLRVVVQEPAAASNFSVQPNLATTATGQDGLRYHSAELGAQEAGKQLNVIVSYSKTDSRTSTQILQPKIPESAKAPAAGSPAVGGSDDVTKGVLIFVLALSLLIGLGTGIIWWRGRERTSEPKVGTAGACSKCGAPRDASDRFCAKCGARLK